MENIKTQRATLHDFDQIYRIYMDDTVNPFMSWPIIEKEEFLSLYKEFYDDLILWKEDNKIRAAVVVQRLKYRRSHVAFLSKLATNPELQGQGLGSIFLKEIILKLKKEKIKRVELIVEADNLKAINFYKKLGFKIEGTMKDYLNREGLYIDDHLMAMIL